MAGNVRDGFLDVLLTGNVNIEEEQLNELVQENKEKIEMIPLDMIREYPAHKFRRIKKWDEFVESVKQHGILMPLLLTEDTNNPGEYVILAGHNRCAAAEELGMTDVPAILMDVDEIEASIIVGVSNTQREEVTDLEWGWAYRTTYELIKKQGARSDLTSGHADQKSENISSLDVLAGKYGVSPKTIQRKMRITYLSDGLAELLDAGKIKQDVAIDLSYLKGAEQDAVYSIITEKNNQVGITAAASGLLKERSQDVVEALSTKEIREIIFGDDSINSYVKKTSFTVPIDYFPPVLKKKREREEYVLKAIEYIKENGIVLEINSDEDI